MRTHLEAYLFITPRNAKHLKTQVSSIICSNPSERDVRTLFRKAGKKLSNLQFENAKHSLQIQKQTKIISDYNAKKQKKLLIDSNKQFTGIEEVIEVQARADRLQTEWERIDRQREAREQSNLLVESEMQAVTNARHCAKTRPIT